MKSGRINRDIVLGLLRNGADVNNEQDVETSKDIVGRLGSSRLLQEQEKKANRIVAKPKVFRDLRKLKFAAHLFAILAGIRTHSHYVIYVQWKSVTTYKVYKFRYELGNVFD